MNQKMAENFIKYGYEDHNVKVFWRSDVELLLFLNGSAVYESRRNQIIYPDCWDKHGSSVRMCNTLNRDVAISLTSC